MNAPRRWRHFALQLAILFSVTCVLPIAASAEKIEPQPVSGKISWVYDYEEGQRLSRQSGKPMFVVFRCER